MRRLLSIGLALGLASAGFAAGALWRDAHGAEPFQAAWSALFGDEDGALILYGNVDIRELDLAFRQSGRLSAMPFEEGDSMRAGDVAADLDATPMREALAVAEAALAEARAGLAKLRAGARAQEIAAAEQAVLSARAALRNAEADLSRRRTLRETGAAAQAALDSAQAVRDEAAAALAAAEAQLSLLREGPRAEDIAAAEARVARAEAERSIAQTALDDAALTAPSDGVVVARIREPGSMVGAGEPVYTLSLVSPVYVRAYVAEPDLGRVAPGTPVLVRSDSSERAYQGQVGYVSPRAEFTPRSVETTALRTDLVYRLRIVVTDPDSALRQGMPVTVEAAATQ
jgi:HlyD family secretion protein